MSKHFERIDMPEAGSPAWLDARRKLGVGASEVSKLLNLSRYGNATDLYLDKKNLLPPKPQSIAMELGNYDEPFIMKKFLEEMECRNEPIKGIKPSWAAKSIPYPWMFANFDMISEDETIIAEFKRAGDDDSWGESWSDTYPKEYWIQIQHQLAVGGMKTCYLAALLYRRNEMRYYKVERDDEFIELLVDETRTFWNDHVMLANPPEGPVSKEGHKILYPKIRDGEITFYDEHTVSLLDEYFKAKDIISEQEKITNAIQEQLHGVVRDSKKVVLEGTPYSISQYTKSREAKYVEASTWTEMRINRKKAK